MLLSEAKKYVAKMDLEDNKLVKDKLKDFERAVNSVAVNLKNSNYKQIAEQLGKLEKAIPEEIAQNYGAFKTVKNMLKNIIEALKKYDKEGATPDFSKFQQVFEESFSQFKDK